MAKRPRDPGLDELLALDGVVLVVDPAGPHWVKFVARRVEPSDDRPHGLNYSLTLHGPDGGRLAGFDNAHAVSTGSGPARQTRATRDHRHRPGATAPYDYRDAATLLRDFWAEVDALLRTKGVIR